MRYRNHIRLFRETHANPDNVFHVVIRTHPEVGKVPFGVRHEVWGTVIRETSAGAARLFAAVLMPDHAHFIVAAGNVDVIAWVGRWKSLSTRASWAAGHHGQLWQRSFYDRGLREGEEEVAVEYVLRNPSAAGLVENDEDWPHRWVAEMG